MGYFKNLAIEQEEMAMGIVNDSDVLHYIQKDISTVTRGVIAHGCNYHGVMGAGVARVLANKYPKCLVEYEKWLHQFASPELSLGDCLTVQVTDDVHIANCITQGLGAGNLATPEAISNSLEFAFVHASILRLPLYLPKIGAGLGGLNWERDVEPIVRELANTFDEVDTYICVYP